MNNPTHIIDPDGEVIIILRNANSPFAQTAEDMTLDKTSYGLPKPESADGDSATDEDATDEAAAERQTGEPMDRSELRIQVSAKHIMFASPVFKKILTGGWKESITYLQKGSVEIAADGWDSEALLILLRAIHCQYNQIPKKVTLEMLARIAAIADYYDCKDVLYIMTDIWIGSLKERIPSNFSRDLILWVWISWFFQRHYAFTTSTATAMSWSDRLINGQGLPIPDKVIGQMNERRQKAIRDIICILQGTSEAFLIGDSGCGFECKSIMHGALTMQIQSSLLSPRPAAPFPGLVYRDLVQKVLSFRSPQWYELPSDYSNYSSYSSRGLNPHKCSDSSFALLFSKLSHSIEGLDLDKLPL